ncbi:DNA resolvase [Burkholderia territorii]|nr:recombinase family protein [Burkholderia territorii]KWE29661.1 DNA resolvase [Burkholderia territorii]KWE32899.1 DNA resolvase [Burkholderia territorii]KWE38137.1 DNA resolvase [Burkholderia territorii]
MKLGYARVSTDEQCLDLQLTALEAAGCATILSDHGVSGSREERPGLTELLARLEPGDTLVVWRLDRLGRSLGHLVRLMNDLRAREISFVSLNEMIDTRSSTGMFMFHMIAALAEFERALVSERTRAGLEAARRRGSRLGRPRAMSPDQIEYAQSLTQAHSLEDIAKQFQVHPRTLRAALVQRED